MPLLTCPNDNAGMQEVNRNGVLIDVCPQCRSVWLDRGELEKLLSYMREDEQGYRSEEQRDDRRDDYRRKDDDDDRYDDDYKHKGKKKRSLFDFFD
jgi:Zn-finger nucleic acid-binding protein